MAIPGSFLQTSGAQVWPIFLVVIIKSKVITGDLTGTLAPSKSTELKRSIGINNMKTTIVTKIHPRLNLLHLWCSKPNYFSL